MFLIFGYAPWWQLVGVYLMIGVVWAGVRGHSQLTRNAVQYGKWRHARKVVLDSAYAGDQQAFNEFFIHRSDAVRHGVFFNKSGFFWRIGAYFAAWPLSILLMLIVDLIMPLIKNVWKVLANLRTYVRKTVDMVYAQFSGVFSMLIARENKEALADFQTLKKKAGKAHE